MNGTLRASAFHARTAAVNRCNVWVTRNDVTLAAIYTDTNEETLAARSRVGLIDLAARWQLMLEGPRTLELLQRLLTRDVTMLSPGEACKTLWLADGGGVRGAAAIARFGRDSFWLLSQSSDFAWIGAAASLFDVSLRDISVERNGVALIGPYAAATLDHAGIDARLEPLSFRKASWRGLEIILSRFAEHGGYEVWCEADDAIIVWDRIMQAGAAFAIAPVGAAAMDVLDVEAGIPRPYRDYIPATDGGAAEPSPRRLGLESLIDLDHVAFNGRRDFLKARNQAARRLAGVEIDSERAAPHTPVSVDGRVVGRTLSSHYSPCLRRAIALAEIEDSAAKTGTQLSLTLPPGLPCPELRVVRATVVDLPFLRQPDGFAE